MAVEQADLREQLAARERELAEAQEQQAAMGRILDIMSSSPTALTRVLEAVAEAATRLCRTDGAAVFRRDGATFSYVAGHFPNSGESWETLIPRGGLPVNRDSVPGRAIADGATFHVEDLSRLTEAEIHAPVGRRLGMRSLLSVPLLREGSAIGAIVVQRKEFRPFTTEQIQLMETFASQAAIAIESARLFQELAAERDKSDRLLLNILPTTVANRLKGGEETIADAFAEITVLFADIVDFTGISSRVAPTTMVALLNRVFSTFDALAAKHGLEKIKTVGDAYMVVGGLPEPRTDHAEAVAEMALDILAALEGELAPTGAPLRVRIGINSGPAVAGVIGRSKFAYDLWGDAVNTASRMESHGVPGAIQVTEATYQRLSEKYAFERRGAIDVKGKGLMPVYLMRGRCP